MGVDRKDTSGVVSETVSLDSKAPVKRPRMRRRWWRSHPLNPSGKNGVFWSGVVRSGAVLIVIHCQNTVLLGELRHLKLNVTIGVSEALQDAVAFHPNRLNHLVRGLEVMHDHRHILLRRGLWWLWGSAGGTFESQENE